MTSAALSPRPVTSVARSDVGCARTENEDAYTVIEHPSFSFYAVADGMGGAPAGGSAALIACKTFEEILGAASHLDAGVLSEVISQANARIYEKSRSDPLLTGMGTTVVALAFSGDRMYVANVGDSRAYCIRGSNLTRLTDDHTLGAELVRTGTLARATSSNAPLTSILTRSLGPEPTAEVDCWMSINGPKRGDIYLLCSDGLSACVSDQEIIAISAANQDLEQLAEALIATANAKGGPDNITVIVVRVEQDFPGLPIERGTEHANATAGRARSRFSSLPLFITTAIVGFLVLVAGFFIGQASPRWILSAQQLAANSSHTAPLLEEPDLHAVVLSPTERAALDASTANANDAEELPNDIERLQKRLYETRMNLDSATRKLSLWYTRYQKLDAIDPLELAAEVSVAHEDIARLHAAFLDTHMSYLRAAEELVYSPAEPAKESRVSYLAQERDRRAGELRDNIRRVVENETNLALSSVLTLSQRRDRIQLKLASLVENERPAAQ